MSIESSLEEAVVRRIAPERADISLTLDKLSEVLEPLRFGSITLTIHDARVVQIDVTEKTRLSA